MQSMRSVSFVLSLLVPACGGTSPAAKSAFSPAQATPSRPLPSDPSESARKAEPHEPKRASAVTDEAQRERFAAPERDDRFEAAGQVAELRRAIALYREFIERAGDDPQFADAVKRSRERIQDAKETLDFLVLEPEGGKRP